MHIKHIKSLSKEEQITLEEMYQHHPNRRYRQRAHMVLLSAQGYCQKEIAQIIRVTPRTVARYIKRYKKRGFLGLYDAPIPGRPLKVTKNIQRYIDKCLETDPRDYGYNISSWTISLMRHHLWIRFGIAVCIETVRQWFIKVGYSLIVPRYLLLEANEKEVEEAKQQIAQLLEQARQGKIVLIFMDEATFKMVPTLTRMWAKKGSKPMIPTYDDKRKIVITGGTDPVTGMTHFRLSGRATKEATLAFLKQIRRYYQQAEIVVMLDSSRPHKANIIKEYIKQDTRMHLVPLPKYAPRLNIQEAIWKWLRKRITHNHLFGILKVLAEAIRNSYRDLQGHPNKVISLIGNQY